MTIRRLLIPVLLVTFAFAVTTPNSIADVVYPPGAPVTVAHGLNTATLRGGDTIVVSHSIVNRGNFSLTGLYLSHTFPPEFYITSAQTKLNGVPISVSFSGKPVAPVLAGYNTYHWVVDNPSGGSAGHRAIEPGDSLELTILAVCGLTGQYILPDRSAVFFGAGSSYFSVMEGPPPVINIQACCTVRGNVDGIYGTGGPVDVADLAYLVNYLFRSGTPPPCYEQANADGSTGSGVQVNVADLSFLVQYLFRSGPAPVSCGF